MTAVLQYLNSREIKGVSLFGDDANPRKYYYIQQQPRLTSDEKGKPKLGLIQYRDDKQEIAGGYFTLEVNLGVKEEILGEIAKQLETDRHSLEPVPLVDGTVTLTILNNSYSAKPSLFGDNQAVFSVELGRDEVTLLKQALFQSAFAPIGVAYCLDYFATRPAYFFRIRAELDRVQKHIEEHYDINLIFFSINIDNIVDSLVESSVLEIEEENAVPLDEQTAAATQSRDRVVQEIKQMVLATFFKPKFGPIQETGGGGFSFPMGFSYYKLDITQIDRRSFNLAINEQAAVRRSIYPQGYLQGLLSGIQQGNFKPDDFITSIDLDDSFFQKRQVAVICRANFERDGINQIQVTLTYGESSDRERVVFLRSSTHRETAIWSASTKWDSTLNKKVMQRDVKVSYKVIFNISNYSGHPQQVESRETVTDRDNLEIFPYDDLYLNEQIPIFTPQSFPWDRYRSVKVEVRYLDEDNLIRQEQAFNLRQNNSALTWTMFVRDFKRRQFLYKLTYYAYKAGDSWETPEWPCQEQIIVRDPFQLKRKVTVVLLTVNWSEIRTVYLELSYKDPENSLPTQSVCLEFSPLKSRSQTFEANQRLPDCKRVDYRVIVCFNQGAKEILKSATVGNRILLGLDVKAP